MIRPLHDYIVIKQDEKEVSSAGGILLATVDTTKPGRGVVVAVGKGKVVDGVVQKIDVRKGDRVLLTPGSGMPMKVDGEEFLFMRQEDILGVLS